MGTCGRQAVADGRRNRRAGGCGTRVGTLPATILDGAATHYRAEAGRNRHKSWLATPLTTPSNGPYWHAELGSFGDIGSKPECELARIRYSLEAGGSSIRFVKGVVSDRDNGNYVGFQMRKCSEVTKDQPLQERLDEESRIKLGVHRAAA